MTYSIFYILNHTNFESFDVMISISTQGSVIFKYYFWVISYLGMKPPWPTSRYGQAMSNIFWKSLHDLKD